MICYCCINWQYTSQRNCPMKNLISFQLMTSIGLDSLFYDILNKYYPEYSQRNISISLMKQTFNDNCYDYNYICQFKPLIEEHVMAILHSNCIRTMCLTVYKDVVYSNYVEFILRNINYFGFCDSMCLQVYADNVGEHN